MKRSPALLGALVLVAAVIGFVVWQRPAAPVPPPPAPKEVVLQYADGSRLWSSTDGRPRPASGGVRAYVPGFSWKDDLAGGVRREPAPGLAEPFAVAGVQNVMQARMTPLDVTAAFATFAAGGVQRAPHLVTTATSADGALLYQAVDGGKPVMGADVADRVTASLKEKPTCNGAACVPGAHPWMVGYTPQLAVTVYLEQAGAAADADLPRVIWQEFLAELAG